MIQTIVPQTQKIEKYCLSIKVEDHPQPMYYQNRQTGAMMCSNVMDSTFMTLNQARLIKSELIKDDYEVVILKASTVVTFEAYDPITGV